MGIASDASRSRNLTPTPPPPRSKLQPLPFCNRAVSDVTYVGHTTQAPFLGLCLTTFHAVYDYPKLKTTQCSSTDQQISNSVLLKPPEYYLAIKRSILLTPPKYG